MEKSQDEVTALLRACREGDPAAHEQVLPLVYQELRSLAGNHMRGESPGHTLQATELVHEAFLRLVNADVAWQDRAHFCSVASRAMRRVLVDHARAKRADKRGGDAARVTLSTARSGSVVAEDEMALEDVLTLDQALAKLAELDERKCRIIEMVYFGGLEHEAIGGLLDISRTTVHRELKFAKAWLKRELESIP